MRTVFTLLLILITCSYGTAQNCTFSKNETDKFTKSRILYTEPIKVTSEKIKKKRIYVIDKVEMQLKYENNSYLINLAYRFGEGMSVANTSSKLILLLADGTTIDAPCTQNMPDQKGNAFTATLAYNFKVSEDDFNKLLKSDITDIRMTAQINPVDFSIAKDIKTSNLFNCIYQNK